MLTTNRTNLISGLLFLGFGILALTVLIPQGIDVPGNLRPRDYSPAYWPKIVCVVITGFGLILTVNSLISHFGPIGPSDAAAQEQAYADALPAPNHIKPFIVIGLFYLYYLGLSEPLTMFGTDEPLGFVLTSIIILAVLMIMAGEYRPHFLLPIAVLIPLALYYFFTAVASVPIPAGVLSTLLVGA